MKATFYDSWVRTLIAATAAWLLPIAAARADCPTDASCRQAGLDLRWKALPDCPDEPQVFADVERLSGRHVEKVGKPQLAVSGVVDVREGTWIVDLEVSEDGARPHTRRVQGSTCREVSDAAAVVIAIALDAPPEDLASDRAAPPPASPPRPPSPRRVTPPSELAAPHRAGFRLAALGGFDALALPGVALGGGLSGGVTYASNRFEARVLLFAPRDEEVSAKSGGSVALYAGAARYCRVFADRSLFDVYGCAGFEAGALDGHGFGFVENSSGLGRWLAPELAFGGGLHPAKGLAIGIELAGLVPIVRDEFRVDSTLVYKTAPADFRLLLSVSYGRE